MLDFRIIDEMSIDDYELQQLIASLPAWRREQAKKFKFEQGRKECALSYHLLRQMIGEEPEFVIGEHGKPRMASEKVHFNLSHCRNAVACAVSDKAVGIDVECLGRYKSALAGYTMSEKELKQIAEAEDSDLAFTLLWTKKEAVLKLTGEGITDDLKNVLESERMNGIKLLEGYDKYKKYAYAVAYVDDGTDNVSGIV